ncbi:hypothetical protein FACS189432_08240 [Bacteroidia bacterium]|nr:hypothetical protein FACS189426_04100 [Bacteroidia bacterium]GHT29227.1 hypothetical protein FACS189432_08240 [Bacteroidia bacterium]
MDSAKARQANSDSNVIGFEDLFSDTDIANMSTGSVDEIFDFVYKFIKREDSAVYPHLDGI